MKKILAKLKEENYKCYFSIKLDTFNEEKMEKEERTLALDYLNSLKQ